MVDTVEYCLSNVSTETRARLAACEFETTEERCLQRCGDCFSTSFLVVDGVLVRGDHERTLRRLAEANG
ncbi:DUF1450 domain-containing protein [Haladaptatus salinisoli]|uniref:DUF1450 domain-containing protein n=1 Tax=Haladaptatus salinisoli TaxID=2884876 RepID=UPI001D0BC216|nr:DUF1450 domain-containing protein [Haladaptatus salinisoli]